MLGVGTYTDAIRHYRGSMWHTLWFAMETKRMTQPHMTAEPRNPQPGALRSQAIMELQTRQAQRLVYGRRVGDDRPAIVGLLRFATMLRPIWSGAMGDDPYADWWLIRVERELTQGRELLADLRTHVEKILRSAPAIDIQVAQSLEPSRVDLNFSNPYAFMGAYLLADFDALVRAILTARHVGLMDRDTSERLLHEGGRAVRRAFNAAKGYRFLAVKREDLRQETAKAQHAREVLGSIPVEVLEGELRADHAPEIRGRDSGPPADESDHPEAQAPPAEDSPDLPEADDPDTSSQPKTSAG